MRVTTVTVGEAHACGTPETVNSADRKHSHFMEEEGVSRKREGRVKGVVATAALAGVCLAVVFVPSAFVVGALLIVPLGALAAVSCFHCMGDDSHLD